MRSYTSGYQTDASASQSDRDSVSQEEEGTGTGTYMPGSAHDLLGSGRSGSQSLLDSRSRTPMGSYTGSERSRGESYTNSGSYTASGSYTPSGSYTNSGSFTPGSGSYTPGSGSYTPGSGSYTLQSESNVVSTRSSSGVGAGGHTPLSSSETGYDICPSSDLTDFTYTRITTESETPTPFSLDSDTLPEVASEKFVTASQASTEFATAEVIVSDRASITSFESFPSIPGSEDYITVDSVSTSYRTASEPGMETEYHTASEPGMETDYRTASEASEPVYATADVFDDEIGTIPSEASTPTMSSLHLWESEPEPPQPEAASVVVVPSVVPSIRSPPSSVWSDLLPEDIPLPASVAPSPLDLPSLSTPTPFIDRALPALPTPDILLAPSPSLPSLPPSSGPSETVLPLAAALAPHQAKRRPLLQNHCYLRFPGRRRPRRRQYLRR